MSNSTTTVDDKPLFMAPRVTIPGVGTFKVLAYIGRDCCNNPMVRYLNTAGISRYVAIGHHGVTWHA
jgi:hypothetical protein